jgi:hypothetical protein
MANGANKPDEAPTTPRYRWPWFALAAILAAIALAILWLSYEVERTRRIRDMNTPTSSGHTQ